MRELKLDPSMSGDEYAAVEKTKTADERRDELTHQKIASENVQMIHLPSGEVTTYHRSQIANEKLFVPALRDEFPRDQFEEKLS